MNSAFGSASRNFRWVASSQIGRVLMQLVSIGIFARLLPASDFGLLAIATVVVNLALLIRDMGTTAAVIQRSDVTTELLDTVFWSNVFFGILTGAIVALCAPILASTFGQPDLRAVLLLLSIAFPLGASGTLHQALLERQQRFRGMAVLELSSSAAGAAAGIFAALKGAGVISLAIQTVSTSLISTILLWILSSWRPRPRWHKREFVSLVQFSGNLVGFNLINYMARNLDGILIGKFLGPSELGFYSIAYRLMLFPLSNLSAVVSRAMFPIYSRQQDQPDLIGASFLRLLALIGTITGPAMFGLLAVREPFVELFLGQKWLPSCNIIAWLAPTGYLQSLVSTIGPVLMAKGRTRLLRNLGLFSSVVFLASFAIGLPNGAAGVAQAYFYANLLASANAFYYTVGEFDLTYRRVLKSIVPPLACTLAMSSVVMLVDYYAVAGLSPSLRLAVLMLTGLVIYIALVSMFMREILSYVPFIRKNRPPE